MNLRKEAETADPLGSVPQLHRMIFLKNVSYLSAQVSGQAFPERAFAFESDYGCSCYNDSLRLHFMAWDVDRCAFIIRHELAYGNKIQDITPSCHNSDRCHLTIQQSRKVSSRYGNIYCFCP